MGRDDSATVAPPSADLCYPVSRDRRRYAPVARLGVAASELDVQRVAGHVAGDQDLQVEGQDNPDHGNVCTSTDNTAGRSRTIARQLSPPSLDA